MKIVNALWVVAVVWPAILGNLFAADENASSESDERGPVAIRAAMPASGPPLFATAQASRGLSRDFGLDGPHYLTYISLKVPHVKWEGKEKTRKWRFDQPDPENAGAVTIYLGGPAWHQERQSRVITIEDRKIEDADLRKLLQKPTPVLISLSGRMVDPYYLKVVAPDTLIVILGSRDLELEPRMETEIEKPANPPEKSPANPAKDQP